MEYTGIYKGIVIDNNDTDVQYSGRVKVFIPEIHGVDLQRFLNGKTNFTYKFPGNNIINDLDSNTLNYLRELCPWAAPMMPVLGGSGPGLYDDSTGQATITDNPEYGPNDDNYPERVIKPGSMYESAFYICPDSFNGQSNLTAHANPAGAEYRVPHLSNCPKGTFSIPRVGATLLVMFYKGNQNFPVYLGVLPSAQDFSNIYNMDGSYPGYPGGYEKRVNTTNLTPPVKPEPTQAEIDIQPTLASSPATPTYNSPVI